jgi:dihydropteroate synthase
MDVTVENVTAIDNKLSQRHIDLDPAGYFIIYIDREAGLIHGKHFTNVINDRGLAVNPETGEVIPAKGKVERSNSTLFSARTAKELCVKIFEDTSNQLSYLTMLDHAAYLGREFVRAEIALITGQEYIQD